MERDRRIEDRLANCHSIVTRDSLLRRGDDGAMTFLEEMDAFADSCSPFEMPSHRDLRDAHDRQRAAAESSVSVRWPIFVILLLASSEASWIRPSLEIADIFLLVHPLRRSHGLIAAPVVKLMPAD